MSKTSERLLKALIHEGTVLGVKSCYGERVVKINSIKSVRKDVETDIRTRVRLPKSARVKQHTKNNCVIYTFVNSRGRYLYEYRILLVGENSLMEPILKLRHG